MNSAIERTVVHYYPSRALLSPLRDATIRWTYDADYSAFKALLRDLEALGAEPRPGTRGDYDISEELVLFGDLHLQLSYLGPWAALNHRMAAPLGDDLGEKLRRVSRLLAEHQVTVLSERVLSQQVPWITKSSGPEGVATVWSCLFVNELEPAAPVAPAGDAGSDPVEMWR